MGKEKNSHFYPENVRIADHLEAVEKILMKPMEDPE